jgi:hypothetical protein
MIPVALMKSNGRMGKKNTHQHFFFQETTDVGQKKKKSRHLEDQTPPFRYHAFLASISAFVTSVSVPGPCSGTTLV